MYEIYFNDIDWAYYDNIYKENPYLFNELIYEIYLHLKYINNI